MQSDEELKKENSIEIAFPNNCMTEPSSEGTILTQEKKSSQKETGEKKKGSKRIKRNELVQGELSEIMNSLNIMDGSKN